MIRWHNCITTCIWCSISRTVTPPAAIDSISAIRPRVCSALIPADGSSSNKQPRLCHQRERDGQAFLLFLRQVLRAPFAVVRQPDDAEGVTSGVVSFLLFALQPARANQRVNHAGLGALAIADQHVVERRGIAEERRRLERAREAETRDLVRLQRRDVVAVEDDASARCRQRAADHVEERGLAGAVRPDDAGDRSGGDREVDLVNGAESAERLAEPMRLEQHHGSH